MIRSDVINAVVKQLEKVFSNKVFDRNVGPDKKSRGSTTMAVWTPAAINTQDAARKNRQVLSLKVRYISKSRESAKRHYEITTQIETAVEDVIDHMICNPGPNYKTYFMAFLGFETDEEENQSRLDTILNFDVVYEYTKGQAHVS